MTSTSDSVGPPTGACCGPPSTTPRHSPGTIPTTAVVLHGDAHPGNTLLVTAPRDGAPAGHVFVDPDGFRGDPAYDAGVVLRDWSRHLTGPDASTTLRGWCDLVAERAEVDPARVWAWSFLERVSTGLYVTSFGAERVGARSWPLPRIWCAPTSDQRGES